MSDDKIAEIRERYAGYSLNSGNAGKANDDRGWLLAEVERMHGLLKDISRDMAEEIESLTRARDEARAEVEQLLASNKRLHRALFRIAGKAPFADDPWTIAAKAMKREAKP